jgi:hypothetical protein
MSRRRFLKVLLAFGCFFILATGLGFRQIRRLWSRYVVQLDESSETGTLSQDEFEVISAVFEVISPKPAPSPQELLEFVNARTTNIKGYYREYKNTVALFESKAKSQYNGRFTTIGEESREKILRDILLHSKYPRLEQAVGRGLHTRFRMLFSKAESRFERFVFPDLMMFYWSSGAGWAAVGYDSYPGIANDPRAYTRQPNLHGARVSS